MSQRDKLAAKARRRIVFAVETSDPGDTRRRADEARQKLLLHTAMGKPGPDRDQIAEDLAQAEKDLAEHYEQVEFQAASPADYEALAAAHFKDKDDEDIVVDDVLPALAAICAVEDELRDEDFWHDLLAPETSTWSVGERSELYGRLVELNVARPDVRIPKG